MKKIISALCACMMLTCSVTCLPLSAEDSVPEYVIQKYTLEEAHAVTEDNLVYCSVKTTEDRWSFEANTVPPIGTCEMSRLLEAVVEQYPDARFSVHISPCHTEDTFAEETKQFAQEHTFRGKTYEEFLAETESLVTAYESVESLTEEEIQTVMEAYRIKGEIKDYFQSLLVPQLEGENDRLRESGLTLLEPRPGYFGCQAYMTAEQLRNFPVNPVLSYHLSLAPVLEYNPEEEAKHTFYPTPADLRDCEGKYGIFSQTAYSTEVSIDGRVVDDIITEEYVPNIGTFDYSSLVGGIAEFLPDVRIGVVIDVYSEPDRSAEKEEFLNTHSMDGKTYAEIMAEFYAAYDAGETVSKELGKQVSQIVSEESYYLYSLPDENLEREPERLRENGIEVTGVIQGDIYAVLTSEQLKNFPAHKRIGYKIGLSAAPGDVQVNGKVDMLDVIIVNKAFLGKESLTGMQINSADINRNGKPDAADSLAIMKNIVGLTETLA